MNQLDRIMELTGRPTPEDIEAIKSPFAATMLESLSVSRARPLNEMFPSASVEALVSLLWGSRGPSLQHGALTWNIDCPFNTAW